MAKLVWDETGKRLYETGVKKGVLYTQDQTTGTYNAGVAWNGLTGVTESPSGAEATALYANDGKYLDLISAEELGGTITAYTYPDEFAACDGSQNLGGIEGVTIGQQDRVPFGLCYRTIVGNDVKKDAYAYKIHIIYGAFASPSEKEFKSVNDSPEAIEFSWEFSTTPVDVGVDGFKPTSKIEIDSTKVDKNKLAALEAKLYGTETTEATLPTPKEIIEILNGAGASAGEENAAG